MSKKDETREKLRALQKDSRRYKRALKKVVSAYVKAPGWASPEPSSGLVWKMYSAARDGLKE